MFFSKKKKAVVPKVTFDPEKQRAVLKCSICNGEQVAGFKDLETGAFTEVTFIRNEQELEEFMRMYQLDSITKEY